MLSRRPGPKLTTLNVNLITLVKALRYKLFSLRPQQNDYRNWQLKQKNESWFTIKMKQLIAIYN